VWILGPQIGKIGVFRPSNLLGARVNTHIEDRLFQDITRCVAKFRENRPMVEAALTTCTPLQRAFYLAASSPGHSGDWLLALPIASCGLRLDDEAVRVAVLACSFASLINVVAECRLTRTQYTASSASELLAELPDTRH